MIDTIKKIINQAVWAPSGDNTQPWRFEVKGNTIRVFNVPEKDVSLYNFKQKASLFAHGSLIENIKIASSYYGYDSQIIFFPEKGNYNLIATIDLLLAKKKTVDDLFYFIDKRSSNRKKYDAVPLSDKDKDIIIRTAKETETKIELFFAEGVNKDKVSKIASLNERVVLENRDLHHFLFSHITWNDKDDDLRRGFFVKTLELNTVQELVFRLFKMWRVLSLLNIFGASRLVAKDNARLYMQSSAIVAVCADDTEEVSFIKAGMVVQRIWLRATAIGLGVQILAGVTFLNRAVEDGRGIFLKTRHLKILKNGYSMVKEIYGVKEKKILLLFRIGYSDGPSARTKRLPAVIKIIT